MMTKRILFFLAAIIPAALSAQPADYYGPPVDIPIYLSANYGEMRTNRFHTGIDIKTQGTVGHPLYAAADGYISRVTVAPTGYGRAIYINHPNGTVTVYGHMHKFTEPIERWLREERYKQKRSDIDAFPEATRFPVSKGDLIGLSGNSGSSDGPHLHYEVRRVADSRTMNVMTHGWISAKDDLPPLIIKLYQIDIDTLDGVPLHSKPKVFDLKKSADGNYSPLRTSPLKVAPSSYYVVEATDRMNDVHNTFGIYGASLTVDGEEVVVFEKDNLLFPDNRYCCASVLYDVQAKSRNEAVMLALRSGNSLPMYKKAINRGVVSLHGKEKSDIKITVRDDAQNEVSLSFSVERSAEYVAPERPQGRIASNRRDFIQSDELMGVVIPKGALYEPLFYQHTVVQIPLAPREDSIRPLSPLIRTGDGAMPLHKAMRIGIEADIPPELQSYASLAEVCDKGNLSYAGGKYKNGSVIGSSRNFGTFCVVSDNTPPTLKASFKNGDNLSKIRTVTFTATDNFSGIAHFSGTIDGKWVIFERQANKGKFFHTFDSERMETGCNHIFEFTVRDGAGNSMVWSGQFFK